MNCSVRLSRYKLWTGAIGLAILPEVSLENSPEDAFQKRLTLRYERTYFFVKRGTDGGFMAKARLRPGSVNTHGDTLEELKKMDKDAIDGYFFDKPEQKPPSVRMHFEEVFALAV